MDQCALLVRNHALPMMHTTNHQLTASELQNLPGKHLTESSRKPSVEQVLALEGQQ